METGCTIRRMVAVQTKSRRCFEELLDAVFEKETDFENNSKNIKLRSSEKSITALQEFPRLSSLLDASKFLRLDLSQSSDSLSNAKTR